MTRALNFAALAALLLSLSAVTVGRALATENDGRKGMGEARQAIDGLKPDFLSLGFHDDRDLNDYQKEQRSKFYGEFINELLETKEEREKRKAQEAQEAKEKEEYEKRMRQWLNEYMSGRMRERLERERQSRSEANIPGGPLPATRSAAPTPAVAAPAAATPAGAPAGNAPGLAPGETRIEQPLIAPYSPPPPQSFTAPERLSDQVM